MPLEKDYITPSTGAVASYHLVQQVSLDKVSTATNATVSSYLSKDAVDAGKFAMYTQQVMLAGLPADGQNAFDYAEAQLVAAPPADAGAPSVNRYVFAGATIVS
ncbi:hypothetical protein LMG24238_03003 [Paraburkholderia sediminicola]|uniref:Uncharacterized protein n=1 Tax=Paraburkholderia sediminicola TaxID=458836 RepID=A0A6J5B278_9BURK|nr:hypothetical protein [Paraburkholderia sediminicola]CAB3688782.1 hypothetical protein LMG24238_03003 [Paraburkholderia sediminicola]